MSGTTSSLLLMVGVVVIFGTAAYAGIKAAPWLPVFKRDIKRIVTLANLKQNDVAYDLGSGDGRVVLALAHNSSATICGYEVSFALYLWSWLKVVLLGLSRQVEIRFGDFLSRDLSQATVIFCFLTPKAMAKLGPKFRAELRPGTRVISYSFAIPGWVPAAVSRPAADRIPIYTYIC
ncbi:MAG: SAM-dependent methyltransferase [Patescibacteria group bacterium]